MVRSCREQSRGRESIVNLIVGAPLWLIVPLAVALIAAVVEDAVRLRISNLICGSVLLLCLIAMAIKGFPIDLWRNVVVFLIVLVAGTLAFSARLIGGGDLKLFAAVALWMTFSAALWLAAAVFLSGGVLATLFILARLMRRSTSTPKGKYIPYGLAIVAGAFLVFSAQLGAFDAKGQPPNPLHLSAIGQ